MTYEPTVIAATTTPTAAMLMADGLFMDDTQAARCGWCRATSVYRNYHDIEWGFPVADEQRLFEKICLEGFQAGLSWLTILNKREAFRNAFINFDATQLAQFNFRDVKRLLGDAGIVRHAGKIASTINNARRVIELRREFGTLGAFVWQFEPVLADRPECMSQAVVKAMPISPAAVALSKNLKKRGWTFVGPTTLYAFMQAMGLVNDHLDGCVIRQAALAARAAFPVPRPGPVSA